MNLTGIPLAKEGIHEPPGRNDVAVLPAATRETVGRYDRSPLTRPPAFIGRQG
jgi:hypothetical protein